MPPKKKVKQCIKCNVTFFGGRSKYCSKECSSGVSDDTRELLSKSRTQYLRDNPDKHPWKNNDKFKSPPCENVKDYLIRHGIEFVEELQPLSERAYSLDIAFPHIRVALEINGQQHYNSDGTLTEYYQQRHDLIESSGWKLIEVHYSQCFNDDSISKFLNFDIPYDDKDIIKEYKERQSLKKAERDSNRSLVRGEKINIKMREKWNPIKDKIFEHDIDFSKYGWATQVAVVMGLLPQKVNKWMKKYHKEFYENSCFKRKKS
jgi:hypothetical protein